MPRVFVHVGLPRTATTVLQGEVFPAQDRLYYLGKNADNSMLLGHVKTREVLMKALDAHRDGDASAMPTLRRLLSSLLLSIKVVSKQGTPEEIRKSLSLWTNIWLVLDERLNDKPMLLSDESFCESLNGLYGADADREDDVLMEQLSECGWLQGVAATVVTREPLSFLTASFYKAMELRLVKKMAPISFDDYLRAQRVLYERKPSASRIFLAQRDKITAHLQSLCPQARSVRYEDLVQAPHVMDALLGFETGTPAVSLASMKRDNKSWRFEQVNQFLLSAPGVPPGTDLPSYRASFPEALERQGLGFLLREGA